jgi:hypothetical protein
LHALRTTMRKVVINEDLTMLIGPAFDVALLEIGALDIDGDDPVVTHAMPYDRSSTGSWNEGGDQDATHR